MILNSNKTIFRPRSERRSASQYIYIRIKHDEFSVTSGDALKVISFYHPEHGESRAANLMYITNS